MPQIRIAMVLGIGELATKRIKQAAPVQLLEPALGEPNAPVLTDVALRARWREMGLPGRLWRLARRSELLALVTSYARSGLGHPASTATAARSSARRARFTLQANLRHQLLERVPQDQPRRPPCVRTLASLRADPVRSPAGPRSPMPAPGLGRLQRSGALGCDGMGSATRQSPCSGRPPAA